VVFDFRLGRGRDGPRQFLGKFEGVLQTDGYIAYQGGGRAEAGARSLLDALPDSGLIWSCRPTVCRTASISSEVAIALRIIPLRVSPGTQGAFGEGLHRRRVRFVRPERFQKASSTSRFILRLVVMYRLVVATEACPR